jgi:hypothetical protein
MIYLKCVVGIFGFIAGCLASQYLRRNNLIYYWRCRLFHPCNVVKVKTLGPTWVDRDELLLHACFQILVDFVEGEKLRSDKLGWGKKERVEEEIEDLYHWWKKRRPGRVDPLSELPDRDIDLEDILRLPDPNNPDDLLLEGAIQESRRLRDEWHAEDQHMLKRLIEVRPELWT